MSVEKSTLKRSKRRTNGAQRAGEPHAGTAAKRRSVGNGHSISNGIAVIGMQGRFPGARDVEQFWANLKNGVESISAFSHAELRAAGIDPAYLDSGYVNRGCTLEGIELFDAGFFGYSARDAETLDPQQRIFMECAWESLELAGYNPDTYPGMIGVFAGSDQSSYLYQIYANVDLSAYGYGGMMAIGNEKDYLTTQISYKLNLRGPSMAVQTSCSTSLVAVCVACQNLRHGYCDIALAGGVAISVPQKKGYWYQPGGIVSPDGHCRPFDARGQGTVVGNGAGVVVLKRLPDALRDRDNVLAVIKGFALNNDGAGKVGYTAPGIAGQARAIALAQQMAGVEPEQIGFIEAHGTATALGDPVEIAGLTKAFRLRTSKNQFCAVGAVKSNVGHLSSAAGITGLIKGILAVEHGQVPPVVHYSQPNPQLDLSKTPFFIASKLLEWPVPGHPRYAGVSSFGVGGTNAHVVLEEAPQLAEGDAGRDYKLVLLSARTSTALETMTANLAARLEADSALDLSDVAFTLQVGRRLFPHRRAVVCKRDDRAALLTALKSRDAALVHTTYCEATSRPLVFMFSGQGAQYTGMSAGLYADEPVFREHLDECADRLRGEIGFDIRDALYAKDDDGAAGARLRQTEVTQPALFALEYSLARLWESWGLLPKAMIGHSIGEYVAACLAGVMTLEDALSVVAMRGRLMAAMPGGSMLAVPLPEASLQPFLSADVCLAAVNAPSMSVLSGQSEPLREIERQLAEQGLPCRRLQTSHAFHSSMMDPVLEQFTARMRRVKLGAPRIPYLSNVTGTFATPQLATSPEYWAHHLRGTVRFGDNVREVLAFADVALLEIGPGHTLGTLARQQGARTTSQLIVPSLPGPQEAAQATDSAVVAWTLMQLWLGGVQPRWRGYYARERRRRVALPTYPFERQRYWVGSLDEITLADAMAAGKPVPDSSPLEVAAHQAPASRAVDDWFYRPVWQLTSAAQQRRADTDTWLVFADDSKACTDALERLAATDSQVTVVRPRARGAKRGFGRAAGDRGYEIRAAVAEDYHALAAELKNRGALPHRVLHFWSATCNTGRREAQAFAIAQERGFLSVVYLAQALGKADPSAPVQIGVVTCQLQRVVGDEDLTRDAAPVLAACKVISQEYPTLRCRAIDIVANDADGAALVHELRSEAFTATVAYRRGQRWREVFERVSLPPPAGKVPLFADGRVHLITGGLGQIALILAEAIAAQSRCRLALVARSRLPERLEWERYVQEHAADPTAEKLTKLLALEKAGAEVLVLQADVADRADMQRAVKAVVEKWGAINGVIHGAGNLSRDAFGPVAGIGAEAAAAQLRSKAHGLMLLEDVLGKQPVEYWLLLSSLSAVLGGLNLACYAAANAYLDAAARQRNAAGRTRWTSVNWDAWSFTGREQDAIAPREGQESLRRILTSDVAHVAVSVTPLADRLARWVEFAHQGAAGGPSRAETQAAASATSRADAGIGAAATAAGSAHSRPSLSTQFVAPRTETEKTVGSVWEHLLGVAPIGVHDKFFELGGHSLLAVQLLARLRETFAIDLPVQQIFETPSIAELAATIDRYKDEQPVAETDDVPTIEEMVELMDGMSESEIESLLQEAKAGEGSATSV